jgi:hypothetical protein
MKRPTCRGQVFTLAALLLGFALHFEATVVFSQAPAEGTPKGIQLSEAELAPVVQAQRNNEAHLFSLPGVVGVGIGLTEPGDALAIHVYLNGDVPEASQAAIPPEVDGIPVRILETDVIVPRDGPPGTNHRQVFNLPVPMGVSTSNAATGFTGTLGMRVRRIGQPDVVGYITNNHIAAAAGPNSCPTSLNPANFQANPLQCHPGLVDAPGGTCRPIGNLVQVTPLIMGQFQNTVDAAFVSSNRELVANTILDIGVPFPVVATPAMNQSVRKSGRTTGLTTGTIQTINMTFDLNYDPPGTPAGTCGTATFIGQIAITPGTFSAQGDSGSVIGVPLFTLPTGQPVGFVPVALLFAGSSTTTFANPLSDVLGALHAVIDSP